MKNEINRFLNGFIEAKKEAFGGNAFGKFVRNDIPRAIFETGLLDDKEYLVSGSVGTGNWAMIPWVGIFYKKITTSATKGVYIVYLLSRDGKRLYLTFNQGCTDISERHTRKETIEIIRSNARKIRQGIDPRGFIADENIDLGDNLKGLGEFYQKGTIFYKEYIQGQVPAEEELRRDLSKMIDIYKEYIKYSLSMSGPGQDPCGCETCKNVSCKCTAQAISCRFDLFMIILSFACVSVLFLNRNDYDVIGDDKKEIERLHKCVRGKNYPNTIFKNPDNVIIPKTQIYWAEYVVQEGELIEDYATECFIKINRILADTNTVQIECCNSNIQKPIILSKSIPVDIFKNGKAILTLKELDEGVCTIAIWHN